MHNGHGVALSRPVVAGVCLQVGFHAGHGRVPDDGVRCRQGQTVRRRLRLDDEDTGVRCFLKGLHCFTALVQRHAAAKHCVGDLVFIQSFLEQFDGVGERHEDQHLVGCFLNDLQHHVDAVADVELNHTSGVVIHRPARNLQEFVDLNRRVYCRDGLASSAYPHRGAQGLVVFFLLCSKRHVAVDVHYLWQVQTVLLLEPNGWLQGLVHDVLGVRSWCPRKL